MNFKFIDLFCGIGGIRIPFDELGGKCVFSSDFDKHVQDTYENNFGERPKEDITKIPANSIPSHDLLLAGFPCQPFSQAGLKKGFEDTRGTLFFTIAEIIEHHKPKVVLLENVKRLRTHDNGNTFLVIERILVNLGYSVFSKILNARDFGLPQNRERLFIVCLRGNNQEFKFPQKTTLSTRVGSILEKEVDDKYTISDRLWAGHKRRKREHKAKGFGFGYSLFNEDSEYTSTMSARYYKDGSEILIDQGKNKNPRKITPEEAKNLQGFPRSFKPHPSNTQAYKQFGNSVAVPVIREISKKLKPILGKVP
jgi:DNA (cytosine-5)-methyltransferase 1